MDNIILVNIIFLTGCAQLLTEGRLEAGTPVTSTGCVVVDCLYRRQRACERTLRAES